MSEEAIQEVQKNYVIYDAIGKIDTLIRCFPSMAGVQSIPQGGGIVESTGAERWDTHYVRGGALIPMPPRPADAFVFDFAARQWVDPRTLEDLKTAKRLAINAARLAANESHFEFHGKAIAADPLSAKDINSTHGIVLMTGGLPAGWPGGWKALDNTYVAIPDAATWGQFYAAMVAQGVANFNHAQELKSMLDEAQTADQVAAIPDW